MSLVQRIYREVAIIAYVTKILSNYYLIQVHLFEGPDLYKWNGTQFTYKDVKDLGRAARHEWIIPVHEPGVTTYFIVNQDKGGNKDVFYITSDDKIALSNNYPFTPAETDSGSYFMMDGEPHVFFPDTTLIHILNVKCILT